MNTHLLVGQTGIQLFLLASVSSQRYYTSQTEVIMVLLTKLLLGDRVQSKDLQRRKVLHRISNNIRY